VDITAASLSSSWYARTGERADEKGKKFAFLRDCRMQRTSSPIPARGLLYHGADAECAMTTGPLP